MTFTLLPANEKFDHRGQRQVNSLIILRMPEAMIVRQRFFSGRT